MVRLQSDLEKGKVDEIEVKRFLFNAKWEPWVEKEWKTKRDAIIQSFCETCGSQENLVLQHTVQPRTIPKILFALVGHRHEECQIFLERNREKVELQFGDNVQKVPVCPKCGSSQVHLRIRGQNKGTYVCNKSRDYLPCKHKFIEPDYGYDERDIKKAEKRREATLRDKFIEEEGLLRIAVEIALEEIIIYLNLDHTKTLCNKCAYKEDRPFDKFY
jgi:hypothetical protein